MNRRDFVKRFSIMTSTLTSSSALFPYQASTATHIACNEYTWQEYFRRENRNFHEDLDRGFSQVAEAGLDGFEPSITSVAKANHIAPLLKKHQLEMRSIYVNSSLHERDTAEESIDQIIRIAKRTNALGTEIVVTNPNPINWGGPENKTDEQLRLQADSLNELGSRLAALGMHLAYHNHDIELREGGREFHHMMLGTDPKIVSLCLDTHWIFRGCGNSTVALFDILKLYSSRVIELHIRQSLSGIWTETLKDGDIDYRLVADYLKDQGVKPHLVLEQAIEKGSPFTLTALEAHRRSVAYAREVFQGY